MRMPIRRTAHQIKKIKRKRARTRRKRIRIRRKIRMRRKRIRIRRKIRIRATKIRTTSHLSLTRMNQEPHVNGTNGQDGLRAARLVGQEKNPATENLHMQATIV